MIYSAAKAAVVHLTRCVAMELGESGVRVNSVSPGAIATGILAKALGMKDASKADRKSTRLNSSHLVISYAVFCLKKKKNARPRPSLPPSTPLLSTFSLNPPPHLRLFLIGLPLQPQSTVLPALRASWPAYSTLII